jgi:hypothetical protein
MHSNYHIQNLFDEVVIMATSFDEVVIMEASCALISLQINRGASRKVAQAAKLCHLIIGSRLVICIDNC